MKKDSVAIIVLAVLLAITLIALAISLFYGPQLQLQPSDASSTESFVAIEKVLDVTSSDPLSAGVIFYNISSTPLTLWNATGNNESTGPLLGTVYNITVHEANFPLEICIIADHALEDPAQGDLPLGAISDEKFRAELVNTPSVPDPVDAVDLSDTVWISAADGLSTGDAAYFRFWLDVGVGVAAGRYNNTVSFVAQEMGIGCNP